MQVKQIEPPKIEAERQLLREVPIVGARRRLNPRERLATREKGHVGGYRLPRGARAEHERRRGDSPVSFFDVGLRRSPGPIDADLRVVDEHAGQLEQGRAGDRYGQRRASPSVALPEQRGAGRQEQQRRNEIARPVGSTAGPIRQRAVER